METARSNIPTANDVLHFENHSKLSAEDIAKAVAHHKRHHQGLQTQSMIAKTGAGKKR